MFSTTPTFSVWCTTLICLVIGMVGCAQQPVAAPESRMAAGELRADNTRIRLTQTDAAITATPPKAEPVAPPGPVLPAQPLTEFILYEFLMAEIAGQRGDLRFSAEAYLDLARRTRDPRIARRAFEIAAGAGINATAVDAARIWQETDPGSTRALNALAGRLIAFGRLDEALPYLKKLMASSSADPGEHFTQLSRALINVPDKQGALKLVQQLASDYPKLTLAQLAVAQVAANAGDEATALDSVRRARELRPESEAAVLMEAQLMQRRSNVEALQVLRKYLDSYPGSRDVRLGYARILVAEKRFGEVRAESQRLVAAFPENTEVIYAVALLSLQSSDHVMAEASLKRLLELDFRDQDLVRIYLGQIAEEQQRLPAALEWYKSVEPGSQYLIARIRYAQILTRQGSLDAARALLQASDVTDGTQRVQLVLAEAQLLRDAGQPKQAFDLVGETLQRLPDNPELMYDYAMLAERIERVDLLESSLRRLIALRPDHAHAYNALGYSLADRNLRLPEARELIEKALQLAPEDAFIVDSMGWVLFRQGALEDALRYLKRAYTARPDPEIAAHLAEVLWIMGDKPEAERVLKEVGDKNPGNETLMKTIKRLKP